MSIKKITVIGLGPMGQAMVQAYMNSGYTVTIWNRTESKSDAMAGKGAIKAKTIADAILANQSIIISLTEYEIMYKIFAGVEQLLEGKVLINMCSDTPRQVEEAERWANDLGAELLSGGSMVPPQLIGKKNAGAYAFYSGKQIIFDALKSDLEVLTTTNYLGEKASLAMLYYQASCNIFHTALVGVIQSYAMITSQDVSAIKFEPFAEQIVDLLPLLIKTSNTAKDIENGSYISSEGNLNMMASAIAHIAETCRNIGINASLPESIENIYLQAMDKGYGNENPNKLVEILRK